ncbi:MAG: hypothetical protein ACI9WU_005443, partial [Myxococcota bacterium]
MSSSSPAVRGFAARLLLAYGALLVLCCAVVAGLTIHWASQVSEAALSERLEDSANAMDQLSRALLAQRVSEAASLAYEPRFKALCMDPDPETLDWSA